MENEKPQLTSMHTNEMALNLRCFEDCVRDGYWLQNEMRILTGNRS